MIDFLIQYCLYLILAVATAFGYFWISQFKEKLGIKEWMALVISIIHTLCGVVCVKLFAFLESGRGGMSLYGAIFFLPIMYYICAKLTKRRVADVFDIFTVCTAMTLMFSRFNCLIEGCCTGLVIPGTESMQFPTREAEILFYIILYIVLRKKVCNHKYSGKIYPYYMISYGAFRFVVEFFRESNMKFGWFHISHIWSLLSAIIGLAAIYLINTNNKKGNQPRSKHKKISKEAVK
ncbi:MAG: prolipoprotein diacylglyceryl transferase [Clostridia bacterium]|nr:prolipoprotein diacylglyceryl transferase [Clostridia bacterium]